MAIRPSYENFINKDLHAGWQHGTKNADNSRPRASSRTPFWINTGPLLIGFCNFKTPAQKVLKTAYLN